MSDLRFLVIEDDLFYQTYVNDLLAETGVDIVNASDGEAGLALASSEKPDLVIMDIEIPKIQGFVLLKNLRENPETKDIPIIMMSGKVEKDLLERHSRLSTHAEGYLMKPFSGQDLIELIRKVLKIELPGGEAGPGENLPDEVSAPAKEISQVPDEVTEPGTAPATDVSADRVPGDRAAGVMRALVVDDSQYIIDIAKDFLKEIGAEVFTALDGQAGLTQAIDNIPDIILLDVQMPGLNGFVVCEKLKKDPRTSEIPVILMSAVVDDESFQRHSKLRYHADAYLQKPFMKSELQDLVTSFISSKLTGTASVESKTGFLVPSEEETAAAAAGQPEKDRAARQKSIEELKKAREAIESARERESQIAKELENARRERDGFEEQLFNLRRSVKSNEKDLLDKLTLTTHRHEEARQEVERLAEENRGLAAQLAATGEVGSLQSQVDDLTSRLGSAKARADELDALNEQLKQDAEKNGADEEAALRLKEAEARSDQAEQVRSSLERDLAAAVAAKNEIEEQVKTVLADTRAAKGTGADQKELETLRKENQELAVRVSEAESKVKWLAEVEKQLNTVQKKADGLREELESVSGQDESAELVTLKEKLSVNLRRTAELEKVNTELKASLAEPAEKNAAELDELSEKAASLEKELADSRKLAAEESESKMDLEGRLESLNQEKELLKADLEEARKLLDEADERHDRTFELEAELEAEKKLRVRSES